MKKKQNTPTKQKATTTTKWRSKKCSWQRGTFEQYEVTNIVCYCWLKEKLRNIAIQSAWKNINCTEISKWITLTAVCVLSVNKRKSLHEDKWSLTTCTKDGKTHPPSCFECEEPSPAHLAFDLAFVTGSSVGNTTFKTSKTWVFWSVLRCI